MSEIIRVSHSQLNQWDRCKFAWKLSYIDKWQPQQKAYPLTLGSTVHKLLEDYYSGQMEGETDYLARHAQKVQQLSQNLATTDDLQALGHAANLVERYIAEFALFEDVGWDVVDVEKHYEVELKTPKGRDFLFELYFDILWIDNHSGRIWLGDHKTHNSRPYTETEVLMDAQLPSYALVMRELMGVDVFGIVYNMLNTYDYKKPPPPEKLFKRIKTYRTDTELDSTLEEIGKAVDEMYDHDGSYRRSLTRDCSWCKFQDPCLMGMKGFDTLPILEANFEKKKGRPVETEDSESKGRL